MKVPLEILAIFLLIWAGWNESFRDRLLQVFTGTSPAPRRAAPAIQEPFPFPQDSPATRQKRTMLDL